MIVTLPKLGLQVVLGQDHGARLAVDDAIRTVGRARDADLILHDLSVSRHHVQVTAADDGVSIVACSGAAPFAVNGRASASETLRLGDEIVVGNTTLRVVVLDAISAQLPIGGTDVRTLLTGAAVDVRGLAAVHALIESLDRATVTSDAEAVIAAWAAEHLQATSIEVGGLTEIPTGFARRPESEVLERATEDARATVIVVPAPGDATSWVGVTFAMTGDQVRDSLRRMVVVAGRVLGSALSRIRRLEISERESAALRTMSFGSARAFLGTSAAAQQLARMIPRLALSDASVLLRGETGTGKSFVARLIHEAGPRAKEPLRVLNCAAIPDSLVESELFGHERGAFTGAVANRMGALESAGRGTLFLDEIGELSLISQAKLLRALEERTFERVGSNRTIALEARILCATNRDLEEMISRSAFRSDLFFRISVVSVSVPALRERGEDLTVLANQILRDCAQSAPRRIDGFAPDALDAIRRYVWPGNVRELRNAIEHAIVLGDGPMIEARDFPPAIAGAAQREVAGADPSFVRLPANLAWLEKKAIEAALRETKGNRTKTAALLGINRQTLYNKLADVESGGDEPK
jgi:DNA-binding NtrC family response regulator